MAGNDEARTLMADPFSLGGKIPLPFHPKLGYIFERDFPCPGCCQTPQKRVYLLLRTTDKTG